VENDPGAVGEHASVQGIETDNDDDGSMRAMALECHPMNHRKNRFHRNLRSASVQGIEIEQERSGWSGDLMDAPVWEMEQVVPSLDK
jgi:hypothetical protein